MTNQMLLVCCLVFICVYQTLSAPTLELVSTGLNNPRKINFGKDGYMYVAENGKGRLPGDPRGLSHLNASCGIVDGSPACLGNTSSISRCNIATLPAICSRILDGYPSQGSTPESPSGAGASALGIADLQWYKDDLYFINFGFEFHENSNCTNGYTISTFTCEETSHLSKLYKWNRMTGSVSVVADLGNFEVYNNPDATFKSLFPEFSSCVSSLNSNPYALHVVDEDTQLIVDAAGNDILLVQNGVVSLLVLVPAQRTGGADCSQFPIRERVPTSLKKGGRDYYIANLGGFPFARGTSSVFKIVTGGIKRDTQATQAHLEEVLTGLTAVADIEFVGKDLYILSIFGGGLAEAFSGQGTICGSLLKVTDFLIGGRTVEVVLNNTATIVNGAPVCDYLTAPGGLKYRNGYLYITNFSILPEIGSVVRVKVASPHCGKECRKIKALMMHRHSDDDDSGNDDDDD
eukprot:TRINITY_DN1935_c0_g2_i1.p1 TRINITY_DN1935_c0_g2~~TRINITY_DN1935_c0_g2_i1.p1  ORF type:complete len:461 (-),score=111.61 TRINITY_DN1935_c0_g2_i1:47-1429(-)